MAEVPQTTRGLGPENLTQGTLLPSFLVSGRSLKGPAHAWNALRLSHPGWQCPSKLRHDHRPQEHKGWVSTVLEEPEPPRILGTPFLSPAHGPAPPQEGKGGCQSLGSQALGPGLEDERTDGCHCHFRWVLGQGASVHWGVPRRASSAVSPASLTHSQLRHRALPLREGEDTWGMAGRQCPSHLALSHIHTHWHTGLAHFGICTAWLSWGRCFLGLQPFPST